MPVQAKVKQFIKRNDELAYRLKLLTTRYAMLKAKFVPDEKVIRTQYRWKLGRELDLENPSLFNEKIQWMKLNYRDDRLNVCVDKYEVRNYIRSKIPNADDMFIPQIAIYDDVDDIDFTKLPKQFILKMTNGSSFNHICMDTPSAKEIEKIKRRFKSWMSLDYYAISKEWAYKKVRNRIVCEQLMLDEEGRPPGDYRFFCFGGKVKVIAVDTETVAEGVKVQNFYRNLYDTEWNEIEAVMGKPRGKDIEKPKHLDDMIRVAERLSEDFPAVRVDFYSLGDKFYFGELTFYPSSGYQLISPTSFEKQLGDWFELPK